MSSCFQSIHCIFNVSVDVVPDMVSIGKPMGNGHPISGVVLPAAVSDRYLKFEAETFKLHQHLVNVHTNGVTRILYCNIT